MVMCKALMINNSSKLVKNIIEKEVKIDELFNY